MKPIRPAPITAAAVLLIFVAVNLLLGTIALVLWGELFDRTVLDDRSFWMGITSLMFYLLPFLVPWHILLARNVLLGQYRRVDTRAVNLLIVVGLFTVVVIAWAVLKLTELVEDEASFRSISLWHYAASIWLALNLILIFIAGYLLLRNAKRYETWRIAYRAWKYSFR